MEVRRATRQDAEQLGGVIARFFVEEGFSRSADQIRARAVDFVADPANAAFLAFDDGAVIGAVTVTTVFGFETGRYAEVEDLYVVPPWRRRGVGRALLEAALRWCRAQGCGDVEVVITPQGAERHGLIEWYRSLGFEDTGRRIFDLRL